MTMVPVYLVEKNNLLREGLKGFLADTDFKITAEFKCIANIKETSTNSETPQLIIVGVDEETLTIQNQKEPASNFRERIEQVKSLFSESRLVLLISEPEADWMPEICSCSIDGYIPRDIGPNALLNYLNLAMMGEKVIPEQIAQIFTNHKNSEKLNGTQILTKKRSFSQRETDIIQCLALGQSNKVIGRHLNITESTVKVHIKTILRKLGVHNRTQVALWAVNNGYDQFQDEEEKRSA